jgi:SAM-dependent methyltransferase
MTDGFFDEAIAATYDQGSSRMFAPEVLDPTLDVLEDLARGGRVVEFAVGTGRVALSLAARGLDVSGIELSRAMVAKLREKPGGEALPVVIGDMTSARVDGEFALAFLVFNTIGNVTNQDGQVEVFRNAAAHLVPGGHFVIEIGVPRLRKLAPGDKYVVFARDGGYVGVDEYDTVTQLLFSHHYSVRDDGTGELNSTPQRYVWPSELDLMAKLAGMTLESRWEDWNRSPFTADSPKHVSVYIKE